MDALVDSCVFRLATISFRLGKDILIKNLTKAYERRFYSGKGIEDIFFKEEIPRRFSCLQAEERTAESSLM